MSKFKREVTVDFTALKSNKDFRMWHRSVRRNAGKLPPLTVEIELDNDDGDTDWIDRAYRYMAEGNCEAAMEELAREFKHLAPPSHECAVADLLAGLRG